MLEMYSTHRIPYHTTVHCTIPEIWEVLATERKRKMNTIDFTGIPAIGTTLLRNYTNCTMIHINKNNDK